MSDGESALPRMDSASSTRSSSAAVAEITTWVGDRLNPILVKESRQALKGRAFATTFISVLLLAWTWSLFGVALQSPGIFFTPGGAYMLMGFLVILALPLIIVVPFSAFRSMASEREDGTFELLSITNLKPWQLITGKLGSVILQVLIYLSALAPCIAFTYFLRGIDIFMIASLVTITILESLLLSSLALLMAAQSRPQRMQNATSVVLLLLLVFVSIVTYSMEFGALASGLTIPVRDVNTWIVASAILTIWASLVWLLILASAAAVTFASDNRSTSLRIATLVTHALWFGWVTWAWQVSERQVEVIYMYLLPMSLFWWFCGSCVAGERSILTPRVRRSLPESTLTRMIAVFFYPGRGLGYFFVVGNILTMGLASIVLTYLSARGSGEGAVTTAILAMGYLIGYLGFGNLLLRWSGTYNLEGPARGVFANAAIIIFGSLVPLAIHLFYPRTFGQDYSLIEMSNVFWSMAESIDGEISASAAAGSVFFIVPFIVALFAVLMLLCNLLFAAREMLIERTDMPQRVSEEMLEAIELGETTLPMGPWDESV